jgi:hypothetical protein
MCVVLNARHVGKRPATDRVYVGRPSKWGNPRHQSGIHLLEAGNRLKSVALLVTST